MYNVMLVDDEPFFIEDLRHALEELGPFFHTISEAYDAGIALEKIAISQPDLVITDIKMPGMDGIALTHEIHIKYPDIICIILSGHQDFELARGALRSGAFDYLLKPVTHEKIVELMTKVESKLEEISRQRLAEQWINVMRNSLDPVISRNPTYPFYCFIALSGDNSHYVNEKLHLVLSHELAKHLIIVSWESDGEPKYWLILAFRVNIDSELNEIILTFSRETEAEGLKSNLFVSSITTNITELREQADKLKTDLFDYLIIGEEHTLFLKELALRTFEASTDVTTRYMKQIRSLIPMKSWSSFTTEFKYLVTCWKTDRLSASIVEHYLKTMNRLLEQTYPFLPSMDSLRFEKQTEILVKYAANYCSLEENYLQDVRNYFQLNVSMPLMTDEDLLNNIEGYLKNSLKDKHSVSDLCSLFAISQSKFNKLFREHKQMSFVENLTHLRMERAKENLILYPKLLISELAYQVGYEDPLYFSKVFKQSTGLSPKEFREQK
jgi:two-component system response regulator YesN